MTFSINGAIRIISVASCLALLTACGGSTSTYRTGDPSLSVGLEKRKVPAMSIAVHKQVQKAQEAMDHKDFDATSTILAGILASERVNGYEKAVAWQLRAMLAYEQDDTAGTITAYENILNFKHSIPVGLELSIQYSLAQLYYSVDEYDTALKYAKLWEPRAGEYVGVSQLTFIAQLHYMRSDYQQTIDYMDRVMSLLESLDIFEVKENWYALKLSAHWELNQYDAVRETLEKILVMWPKPRYCTQLASIKMLGENGISEAEALESTRSQFDICANTVLAENSKKISKDTFDAASRLSLLTKIKQTSGLPLVRVQPQYPRKAVNEKIEGEVIVEITIKADGTVDRDSISIVEATPKGYFEDAAIRAVSMFKYKPKIVNGKPVPVTGVRYKFTWDMTD